MMAIMALRQARRLGYLELVTDFFTGLQGRGLMLSPVDTELVHRWEARGIPVEVVCRGLQASVEAHQLLRPGVPPPHRLAYYAAAVDEAFRAAREKAVGRRDP